MDQLSKMDKIASARKKLKQYQSKKDSNRIKETASPNLTPSPTNLNSSNTEEVSDTEAINNMENNSLDNIIKLPKTSVENSTSSSYVTSSSIESLNQLSARVNSLMMDQFATTTTSESSTAELEKRNQELSNALQAEKFRNDEMSIKVRDLNSTIDRLNIDIDRLKVENATKVKVETGPLQEQLQSYIQTVGILVGEKAELQAYLKEYQNAVTDKRTENEELQTRLRASRFRVNELERELKDLRDNVGTDTGSRTDKENQLLKVHGQLNIMTHTNEELKEQVLELKQKINLKNNEINELQSNIDKKVSEINMANLRIEQLSAGKLIMDGLTMDSRLESLSQQNIGKDMQISELKKVIEQLSTERDQSNAQYQSYVLQLNREISSLGEKMIHMTEENDRLNKRETELVKHVAELEKQIQQQISKQKVLEQNSINANNNDNVKMINELEAKLAETAEKLNKSISELKETKAQLESCVIEKASIKSELNEKLDEISTLEMTIERIQADNPDTKKIISEIESHKVAASRAMTQNAELRAQLEEMQIAYITLSNNKLELTEMLQTEQHLCREMRATYSQMEEELKKTKEHLHLKDEEMIRLAHETTDLNKKMLLQDQELDRLRHYDASNENSTMLQRELENCKEVIEQQRLKILELEQNSDNTNGSNVVSEAMMREIDTLQSEKEELVKVINDFQTKVKLTKKNDAVETLQNSEVTGSVENDECANLTGSLPIQEALEKLQERFKKTIITVAELTDEKQRLEHLVAQLQFETETIGEYITLYQNQRRQLKQKDLERDIQLQNLAVDREKMREKLMELNLLIEQLLTEKRKDRAISVSSETTETRYQNGETEMEKDRECKTDVQNTAPSKGKARETANKILLLLSDIQSANQASLSTSGVDHCACCSGKLEVV